MGMASLNSYKIHGAQHSLVLKTRIHLYYPIVSLLKAGPLLSLTPAEERRFGRRVPASEGELEGEIAHPVREGTNQPQTVP